MQQRRSSSQQLVVLVVFHLVPPALLVLVVLAVGSSSHSWFLLCICEDYHNHNHDMHRASSGHWSRKAFHIVLLIVPHILDMMMMPYHYHLPKPPTPRHCQHPCNNKNVVGKQDERWRKMTTSSGACVEQDDIEGPVPRMMMSDGDGLMMMWDPRI